MAEWACPRCGFRAPLTEYHWRCPRCGSPLTVRYDYEWRPRGRGLARYSSMLPLQPRVSLGEGSTPHVKTVVEGVRVHLKLEQLNPTGSFKDRGTALTVSHAVSVGARLLVEDTSGNTGVSVAGYAAAARLRARIYVPRDAPRGKKVLMRLLGAEVVEVADRGEAARRVLADVGTAYYVAHTWNPLYIEGAKTIALEAYEEGFRGRVAVAPVGSGGLILGLYKGFTQLSELGLADTVSLVAVQGVSVAPVYEKLYGRRPPAGDSSLADGIRVASPPRLDEIAEAVKRSGGCAVVVDNNDIVKALRALLSMGLVVEPTSAAGLAGLVRAVEEGCVDRGDEVLLPLTGSGLKMVEDLARLTDAE